MVFPMFFFVFGTLPDNSGKTCLSRSLIIDFINDGRRVSAFKPLSGHNFWWQYDNYLRCLGSGSLFSEDAYRLWVTCGKRFPLEVINPADLLLSVPDMSKAYFHGVKPSDLLGCSIYNWFIAGRFTLLEKRKMRNVFYFREDTGMIETKDLVEVLKERAEEYYLVRSFRDFLLLHKRFYLRAAESCFKHVLKNSDVVVVEGFNDSVYPFSSVKNASAVLGVSPGFILVFEPETFFREVKKLKHPFLATFNDIVNHVSPVKVVRLPALRSDEISNNEVLYKKYRGPVKEISKMILKTINH